MAPSTAPPDRPVIGNASAGTPAELRFLTRFTLEQNDESGAVVAVTAVLSAGASQAYRAEVAGQLGAMFPSAEIVVE